MTSAYRRLVERETRLEGIAPWEFWRTLRAKPFVKFRRPYALPEFEDPGRAVVLAAGFAALRGVSPYLLLWLGALVAIPVLTWLVLELADAGHAAAGGVFAAACALSPYLVESLSLPHSAVAFYLIGLMGLLALAVYAVLGRERSPLLFACRAAVASAVFTTAVLCRSGSLLFLPAFLVALLVAAWRVFARAGGEAAPRSVPRSRRGRAIAGVALCALFVAPHAALRPKQRHTAWLGIWEGLGDFAEDRGYSWYDTNAKEFLRRAGLEPFRDPKDVRPEHEAFFRSVVLADVRRDPLWYAGVLAKRTVATLAFTHLSPWGPRDGESLERPLFHYKYTTPADWFYASGEPMELPVSCLWGPPAALVVAWAATVALRRRWDRLDPAARKLGGCAAVLALGTLAALPVPAFVSTASGLETQAFLLVCLVGLGFVVEELARAAGAAIASARRGLGLAAPSSRLPSS